MRSVTATSRPSRGRRRSAALVRTKNACSGVAPASAPRCFSRDRKIHDLPLEIGRELDPVARRVNTQRVCSLDRAQDERRETARAQALPHRVEHAAAPAKLTLPCSAATPGCNRMNVFTPIRCKRRRLLLPDLEQRREPALQRRVDGRHAMPDAALIAAREHAGHDAARRHAGAVAAEVAARPHAREIRQCVPARLTRRAQPRARRSRRSSSDHGGSQTSSARRRSQ